jgi:hypothetical protein
MKGKAPWSRADILTAAAVVIAILTLVAGLLIPEVRSFFGLEESASAPVALPQAQVGGEKHQLSGFITDGRSRKPIPQVHVSVDGGLAVHDDITDTNGYFRLELTDNVRDGAIVRLKIAKSGYVTYDESVAVPSGPLPVQITLEPERHSQGVSASEKPVEWISVGDNYGYEKDGSMWTGNLVKASRDIATPVKLELKFTGPVLGDPTIKIIEGVSLPVSSSFLRRNDNTFIATIANPPLKRGDFLWVKATSKGAVAVSVTCLKCPSK